MKRSTSSDPKRPPNIGTSSGGPSGLVTGDEATQRTTRSHSKPRSRHRQQAQAKQQEDNKQEGGSSKRSRRSARSSNHRKQSSVRKHHGKKSSMADSNRSSRKVGGKSKSKSKSKRPSKIDAGWLQQSRLSVISNIEQQQLLPQNENLGTKSPSHRRYSVISNAISAVASDDEYDDAAEAKAVLKAAYAVKIEQEREQGQNNVKKNQSNHNDNFWQNQTPKPKCHFNPCCTCGGKIKLITWCRALGVIEMVYSLVYFVVKMTHQSEKSRLVDYKEWQVFMDSLLIGTVVVSFLCGIILTVAACCVIKSMAIVHAVMELLVLVGLTVIIAVTAYGRSTEVKNGRTILLVTYAILYPIKVYTMICSIGLWTLIRAGIQNDQAVIKVPDEAEGYQTSVH